MILTIYTSICILFGLYAVMRHWQINDMYNSIIILFFIFILNALLFPISISMAIYRGQLIPTKEQHLKLLVLLKMKDKYAVYEKTPGHGKDYNGVILGPYNSKEEAEKEGKKYGYTGEDYYVDVYHYWYKAESHK